MVTKAEIKVTKDGANELHLVVLMQEAVVSKSGKTMVVASTRGFQALPVIVNGKPVSISLNGVIPS